MKEQTAGSPAWLLEPEAGSTSEGIIDDALDLCTERRQARTCKYSQVCVCFNLGFFIASAIQAGNTFSSKYLTRLPVFIRKRWKLFTLFINAIFYHAELFGHQRLLIRTIGANKDGWRIHAASCFGVAKPLKPRRQPPPSCADNRLWLKSERRQDHLSRFVRTAFHGAQPWISMLNLIFSPRSIRLLLTLTYSYSRSGACQCSRWARGWNTARIAPSPNQRYAHVFALRMKASAQCKPQSNPELSCQVSLMTQLMNQIKSVGAVCYRPLTPRNQDVSIALHFFSKIPPTVWYGHWSCHTGVY